MDYTSMREALEAARNLLLPQCNGGTAFAKACGETVNKIMDALKDERTSDGNAAAMREALERVEKLAREFAVGNYYVNDFPKMLLDAIQPALAKPPRNCDVGTAEEQWTRVRAFCKRHKAGLKCVDCPVNGVFPKNCALIWAQMPYEEEGTK